MQTYSISQVAEILGISVRSVYRYVETCRQALPTLTHGDNNRLLFRTDDVNALAHLVNLRKSTGAKLEALTARLAKPEPLCQDVAEPPTLATRQAKPEDRETGPNIQELAAQVAELRAELNRVRAERAEDRAAMLTLVHRIARLNRPALLSSVAQQPASSLAPRPWRPMALPPPSPSPKPRQVSWWRAFLRPHLLRNEA